MPTNYYFLKLHYDIIDDWKVGTLPDSLKWRFIQCLCVAGECQEGGLLPELNQFAYRIRQEPTSLNSDMARLAANQLVELVRLEDDSERWFISNYEKRQARSTSTERTRRQRERDRKAGVKREYWQKNIYSDLPESPGVYSIECAGSKKVYIGGSKNIKSRVRAHLSNMNTGGHAISGDLEKYGKTSITATALELTDDTAALPGLENKWIGAYDPTELYNNPQTPGKRHRAWDRTEEGHGWDEGGTTRPTDKNRIDIDIEEEKEGNKSKNTHTYDDHPENQAIDQEFQDVITDICNITKNGNALSPSTELEQCANFIISLGTDAADRIPGFADWWSINSWYDDDGLPSVKTVQGDYKNYLKGVTKKKGKKTKAPGAKLEQMKNDFVVRS